MDSPGGAGPTAAGRAPRPPARQAQAARLAPPVRAVPGEERCAEPARPAERPVAWSARPAERQAWGRRVAPEVARRAAARPAGPGAPVRTWEPRSCPRSGAWRGPAAGGGGAVRAGGAGAAPGGGAWRAAAAAAGGAGGGSRAARAAVAPAPPG